MSYSQRVTRGNSDGAASAGPPASEMTSPTLLSISRRRLPDRLFEFTPQDLFETLQHHHEDVMSAIDGTLKDRYLENMARQQLGSDYGMDGGDKHRMDMSITQSRATASTAAHHDHKGDPLYASTMGGVGSANEEPPVDGNIAPYVRPPARLNGYEDYVAVLEAFIPFGVIIPVAVLCLILVGYMYAKVRLCGGDCECEASDIALITLTFGLIRDLPSSIVFSCLTEACIEHQRDASQTTLNRKSRSDNNSLRTIQSHQSHTSIAIPKAGSRSDGFKKVPNSSTAINADEGSNSRYYAVAANSTSANLPNYHGAYTYGPYILEGGLHYLLRKRVLALIVAEQIWVMLYRAFASPIGIPDRVQLPLLLAIKILPFVVYALAKKKVAASSSACLLIIMPMAIEIITEIGKTAEGDTRTYLTGFFPLFVLIVDRLFLFLMNITSHPSRSVGAVICFCTMHAFYTQNLMLGVALTISAKNSTGLVVGYGVSFVVVELLLNTVTIERIFYAMWRAITRRCSSGGSVKKNAVDPLGKYSLPNIASLVRLPTIFLSFLFLLPAMHFPRYPYKTPAVDCDGVSHYFTSWPTYGVLGGVVVIVAFITILVRSSKGLSNVPLCVYGVAWSLMVSFYCLQIVPISLAFLPAVGGEGDR
eukprot:GILI01007352.1.p1 GENE.GILI01007352.1~~GILI01007352.1.p1  ORF type:complete len:647 (+),score=104.60 GILI01007352.1:90-2030(+)